MSVVVAPQESKESRRLARIHENPAGESTRIQRENPAVRFAAERNLRNLTEKFTSKNLASFTAKFPTSELIKGKATSLPNHPRSLVGVSALFLVKKHIAKEEEKESPMYGGNTAFCSRRPRKINSATPFCAIETNQVLRL